MSVLFSVYVNNYQNLIKLSNEVKIESQKLVAQTTDKIQSGFMSFVHSISNSFVSLQKMFSFSSGSENSNNNKECTLPMRTASTFMVGSKNETTEYDLFSESSRQNDFNILKTDMHARLNTCFKHPLGA